VVVAVPFGGPRRSAVPTGILVLIGGRPRPPDICSNWPLAGNPSSLAVPSSFSVKASSLPVNALTWVPIRLPQRGGYNVLTPKILNEFSGILLRNTTYLCELS